MNKPTVYTPLESLFLFQSLLAHGVDANAFLRISELLKNNALIKGGATYDAARFTPEALQQLFLLLLGEELKSESERQDSSEGITVPNQKKRKAGSPPLPTLKDAIQYIDKVPMLVDRLYTRYRDHVVKEIREDERKFEAVQKDIQLLERSEKERLARSASQSGTPVLAPRDVKAVGSNSPSPSPGPVAGVLSGIKRGPPLAAAKLPAGGVPSPGASTPSHLQQGNAVIRPSPSPKPQTGAVAPPPHAIATGQQNLKPALQSGKPILSPKPDPSVDGQGLKWERPYSPQLAGQSPTTGTQPLQPLPGSIHAQRPGQRAPQSQSPLSSAQSGQPRPIPGKPLAAAPHPNQTATPSSNPVPIQSKPPVTNSSHGRAIQPTPIPDAVRAALTPSPAQPLSPATQTPTAASRLHPPAQAARANNLTPLPAADDNAQSQASPYNASQPRPAIPDHMIRQAAGTPTPTKKAQPPPSGPQTPTPSSPMAPLFRGLGTKWASTSTPSTPRPILEEPESPAFEPVSPPQRANALRASSRVSTRDSPRLKTESSGRPRGSRSSLRGRGVSATRSPSATPQPEETVENKIKRERLTPKPQDDAGDTTADESVHGRPRRATPAGRNYKRKRNDTPIEPPVAPTHVLWTRGFTKVSSSALDQISSHRDANMFATALRERDAPNYRQVVLQPQDITSIRAAIKHGNKAATQAATSLSGGDPGTPSVWVPISEDLVPPRAIINSAQLERELVHMFCNAIMYNPDPDRGFGPAFMKRSQEEEEEALGYELDENGVVRNTQGMFVEVEKLLSDLRAAEKDRAPPAPSGADDTVEEEDEDAGDANTETQAPKRRRVSARN